MSVLSLFPARIRWSSPDGTLTPEALRMLDVLVQRVGGMLGDIGADVFAMPEPPAPASAPDLLQQLPATANLADLVQQAAPGDGPAAELVMQQPPYSAGTALALTNYSFSLKDTAVVPGIYGDAATVPKYTVDQQGRLILATNVPIQIAMSQVTGLGTMAAQDIGTNFTGSFTGKTVTVVNGIITSVV